MYLRKGYSLSVHGTCMYVRACVRLRACMRACGHSCMYVSIMALWDQPNYTASGSFVNGMACTYSAAACLARNAVSIRCLWCVHECRPLIGSVEYACITSTCKLQSAEYLVKPPSNTKVFTYVCVCVHCVCSEPEQCFQRILYSGDRVAAMILQYFRRWLNP